MSKKKKKPDIELFSAGNEIPLPLQLAEGIKAGFPSPAQDYLESTLELNKELIKNPASTFYGRITGDSMQEACVDAGDIVVIDKSLDARNGDMVLCFVDGEFTLKFLRIEKDAVYLVPANPKYPEIKLTEDNQVTIWGVVTFSIKDQHKIHRHRH